jgi:hypothetical protein
MLSSGELTQSFCRWNLDRRYPLRKWTLPIQVRTGDRVFLKISDIPEFVHNRPPVKVDLVVHNSDETFTEEIFNYVQACVRNVYTVNCASTRAVQIPLGFRDHQYTSHHVLRSVFEEPQPPRTIQCLVNFLLTTNVPVRKQTLDYFRDKPFATVQESYTTYSKSFEFNNPETMQRRVDFYRSLRTSRFAICPAGTGYDTHRVYECILFGVIPIVKTSPLDKLYSAFPVWIVRDWSDVTEESMNACPIQPNPASIIHFKMPWEKV